MRICTDVETLPTDDPVIIGSYPARVRKDLKDPVKIAEAATKLWSRSSVDPVEARICSIAVKSAESRLVWCGPSEETVVRGFAGFVAQNPGAVWYTWNGREFDFRALWLRALRYRLAEMATVFNPNFRQRQVDLMLEVGGHKRSEMLSLKRAAHFFRIPFDDSFDGSMVFDAAMREKWDLIAKHNLNDVDVLYQMVLAMEDV